MFHRVIVPTDGSDRELWALEEAVRLAKSLKVGMLALSVIAQADTGLHSLKGNGAVMDVFGKKREGQAKEAVERLVKLAKKGGVPCKTQVVTGSPAEKIAEAAKKGDLIVMPTKGLARVSGLRVGSVTARVVELAPCPVLVYKAPDAEYVAPTHAAEPQRIGGPAPPSKSRREFLTD